MATLRPALLVDSAVTALVAARMPPMPRPVMKRQIVRLSTPVAAWAMYMPMAMITRQPSIAGLRPTLSATPPRITEPKPMPISSADSTIPSAARSMPHSLVMPGAANALDSTSNPSSALRKTIRKTTIHCRVLIGLSSTTAIGLLPPAIPAILFILSLDALSFVDSRQHFHQFFDLFGVEAPLQPSLVRVDRRLGFDQ